MWREYRLPIITIKSIKYRAALLRVRYHTPHTATQNTYIKKGKSKYKKKEEKKKTESQKK